MFCYCSSMLCFFLVFFFFFFFFKQKTAYEMRISDWSSDVCSSDLGAALVRLLEALEERFNGHVFRLTDDERAALAASTELTRYARLVEGYEDSTGQLSLWRIYSFRDLPVELISINYQLFVKDASILIYTPPALVRLIDRKRTRLNSSP